MGLPAPFAVAYAECSFRDTSAYNSSRQGLWFRGYQDDDPTQPVVAYYLGTDYAAGHGSYHTEIYSASAGWTKHKNVGGARSVAWRTFKIRVDSDDVKFYVDGALKDTVEKPTEGADGCSRVYIGHENNVNQTGCFDDVLLCAPVPPAPSALAASAVAADSITWNWIEGARDYEQGFYLRDAGGALNAAAPRNSASVAETGLVPNTQYTRTMSAFNGSLESAASPAVTSTTLSTPLTVGSITADPPPGGWAPGTVGLTSSIPFGPGGVAGYRYAFDQSPTHSFAGDEATWNGGTLALSAAGEGDWYVHLVGCNSEGVANGSLDLGPFHVAQAAARISDAKVLGQGAYRQLIGKPVVAAFPGRLYIEEPDMSSATAVVPPSGTAAVGDVVDIVGSLSSTATARFISAEYLRVTGSTTPPAPLYMSAGWIGGSSFGPTAGAAGGVGLNNVGLLVVVFGVVSESGVPSGVFKLSDGSRTILISAPGLELPREGSFVRVVGISRLDDSLTPFVQPRSQADIRPVP